jgi:protocatechuate 3,4-dioxygenase beta subunit
MMEKRNLAMPARRQILETLGAAAALGAGARIFGQTCVTPSSPALTEGPYFMDEILNRSNITEDPADNSLQPGLPLSLTINLKQLVNCATIPLTGAYVDIWHCNATGVYSDVAAQNTTGRKFLRGYQATDRSGAVTFSTIYPGWYTGRAVHIHGKIRIFNGLDQIYSFTTQFFFDETATDKVFTLSPYNNRGARDTFNTSDGIYRGASSLGGTQSGSGAQLMLKLDVSDSGAVALADITVDESLGRRWVALSARGASGRGKLGVASDS